MTDRLARDRLLGRIIGWPRGVHAGDRPDPPDVRSRRIAGHVRRLVAREIDGASTTLGRAEHVEAYVGGDAKEPRPERPPPLELLEAAPGSHERLLDGVVRLERRSHDP